MNIRMVWLATDDDHLPSEHIVYLDHVSGMGESNLCGYIVREKSQGRYQPVERLLTKQPMTYWQAVEYWRVSVLGILNVGYHLTSGPYQDGHFRHGWSLPALSDPLLEHLSAPMHQVFNESPDRVRNPPPPPPPRTYPPINLPPYNPPSNIKPPVVSKPRPAPKPKRKPVRLLPMNTGRRIILED